MIQSSILRFTTSPLYRPQNFISQATVRSGASTQRRLFSRDSSQTPRPLMNRVNRAPLFFGGVAVGAIITIALVNPEIVSLFRRVLGEIENGPEIVNRLTRNLVSAIKSGNLRNVKYNVNELDRRSSSDYENFAMIAVEEQQWEIAQYFRNEKKVSFESVAFAEAKLGNFEVVKSLIENSIISADIKNYYPPIESITDCSDNIPCPARYHNLLSEAICNLSKGENAKNELWEFVDYLLGKGCNFDQFLQRETNGEVLTVAEHCLLFLMTFWRWDEVPILIEKCEGVGLGAEAIKLLNDQRKFFVKCSSAKIDYSDKIAIVDNALQAIISFRRNRSYQ